MAKKFKVDLSGLKPILLQYGDKAALGLCAVFSVLLIGMGLLNARSASRSDYAADIKRAGDDLDRRIQGAELPKADPEKLAALDPTLYDWKYYEPRFLPSAYINLPENPDTKRRNPVVSVMNEGADHFQLNYIRGLYHCYALNPTNSTVDVFGTAPAAGGAAAAPPPGAGGGTRELVKAVEPVRMVVVSTVFPMRDQVEKFRQAFRLGTQQELFALKDVLPRPLGVDVYRYEVMPDGTDGSKTPLYLHDPRQDSVEVAKPIAELLRRAMLDEETLAGLDPILVGGLVTPVPLLANVRYPKLKLAALELPPEPNSATKAPVAAAPAMAKDKDKEAPPIRSEQWKKLLPEQRLLVERFEGKFEPFHPFGQFLPRPEDAATPAAPPQAGRGDSTAPRIFNPFERGLAGVAPGASNPGFAPPGPGRGPRGGAAPTPAIAKEHWPYDALIRFIDVGVEAGKSYRYELKIRLANPNFGKPTEVAAAAMADVREIASPRWTRTPTITIPGEYDFYAVDQQMLDKGGPSPQPPKREEVGMAPMQIHRWFERTKDVLSSAPADYIVGDWAVAERLMVRRGEFIGHHQIIAEVPIWRNDKGAFEVPSTSYTVPNSKTPKTKPGVPLDFLPPPDPTRKGLAEPAPLLVDFEGGRKDNYAIARGIMVSRDECAIDVLIMLPDGRLAVRNTRIDADAATRAGKGRKERLEQWREHCHNAGAAEANGNPSRPNLPGAGGFSLPGGGKQR
jgi:hypothetical protein